MFNRLRKYFHERKLGKNVYLIYSMGKVGSSTLMELFEQQYPFLPAFQLHFLSDYWIKEKIPSMPEYYHINLKPANEFNTFLQEHPDYSIKIITLVREPVIRDISDIFENWTDFFKTNDSQDLRIEKILERLKKHDFEYTLNWFDNEFKAWTGVDIFKQPFDKEKGYSIWKSGGKEILCIKLEKLDEVLNKAMLEFCGLNLRPGSMANVSANKKTRHLYKQVTDTFRLTPDQEMLIYSSQLVNHFYTEAEIINQKKRWASQSQTT